MLGKRVKSVRTIAEVDVLEASASSSSVPPSPSSGAKRDGYSSQNVQAALVAFYKVRDPSKLPTVDYFVSWINSNGVDAFNDLLFIKYGAYLDIGRCSATSDDSESIIIDTGKEVSKGVNWEPLKEFIRRSPLVLVGATILFLAGYLQIYGHLATANLVILCLGWTVSFRHMRVDGRSYGVGGSSRKVMSSVLHVFWTLFAFFFLIEGFIPSQLKMRFEYTLLKLCLFGYLYFPGRVFREQKSSSSDSVVKVRLLTVMRDVILFCAEAFLLFVLTSRDGTLGRYDVALLVGVGAGFLISTRSLKNRDMVVDEIRTSEEQFAHHLRSYKRAYLPGLANVLSVEEMDVINRHLESIATLSELFVNELKAAATRDQIGPAFLKFVPFFKMYAPFCADHEAKRLLINQLKARKSFCEAIENIVGDFSERGERVQSIESYLIMPVQRVPRYVLLLKEVLKNTPKWHFDREPCVEALAQIEEIATYIDEAIAARAEGRSVLSPSNRASSRFAINRTTSSSSTISTSSAAPSSNE